MKPPIPFELTSAGEFQMRRDDAKRLLFALDAELHPWSEVGEVPTEPGAYWAIACNGKGEPVCSAFPVVLDDGDWYHDPDPLEPEPFDPKGGKYPLRFRRRWTPEAPR